MVLTRDEVDGLMAGLLTSDYEPTGTSSLGYWLGENADSLGRNYMSELRRNYLSQRLCRTRQVEGWGTF